MSLADYLDATRKIDRAVRWLIGRAERFMRSGAWGETTVRISWENGLPRVVRFEDNVTVRTTEQLGSVPGEDTP
jgi:hypothetical protein